MNKYNRLIILLLVHSLYLITNTLFAQYNTDQSFTIIDHSSERLIIQYNYPNYNKKNEHFDTTIHSCCFVIPDGATANYQIIQNQTKHLPAEQLFLKSSEAFTSFPTGDNVSLSQPKKIRGLTYLVLTVSPFKYDQKNQEMIFYSHLEIQIDIDSGDKRYGEDRLRNRYWDYIYKNLFLNYSSLPKIDYNKTFTNRTEDDGAEYLIICPNNSVYQQWADSIKNFRTTQGIPTIVVTLEEIGGNTSSDIENYINEAYNTWEIPPVAVLCLGDHGTDPNYHIAAPVWDNYCVSDNVYADVDNDDLPDMFLARMCAENPSQLETMVTKFINYEKYPPTNPDFYNNPITSCNFHQGGYFQLLTESIAGFYENVLGKSTNRINVGPIPLPYEWGAAPNVAAIVQTFGPDGLGYIPASPGEVNCSWNSTAQDVIDGINNGAFMLLHRSEAYEQGWGQPQFTNDDINGLTNADLTFVWSPDNLIGKFNSSTECFAEKFHRHNNAALGVIAASEISYGFINEIYTWGAWDMMWPNFLPESGQTFSSEGVYPAFANAAGKYYLDQSPWPINPQNKKVAYHTLHYFGDAFSTIYTDIPQTLEISHASTLQVGDTSFEVTANEGSLIGLSLNNELIGVAEGTGEPVVIQIQPQTQAGQMLVTATKQNYFRYENTVPVIGTTAYNEEKANNEIIVYPNPSQGKLSILCYNNYETVNITVINVLSKIVFKASNMKVNNNTLSIDLENQSKGIYYFIISSGSRTTIKKVIIH